MDLKDNILIEKPQVHSLRNSAGLKFSIFENGSIKNIEQGLVQINLLTGSPLEPGCSNLYLRIRGNKIKAVPMIGPKSFSNHIINKNTFEIKGEVEGILYSCRLLLAKKENSWLWDVHLTNTNTNAKKLELDILYVQDVGLSSADGNEKNELYISQYIDYTSLSHQEHGQIVCCRQNEHGSGSFPWLALGSISQTNSFSTDGMQFFGQAFKQTGIPKALSASELDGLCQQEFAIAALQEKPFILESGHSRSLGFFGVYCPNHVVPTSSDDLMMIDTRLCELKNISVQPWSDEYDYQEPVKSLFSESDLFISEDLTDDELNKLFTGERRHCEFSNNELLSFFYGENSHVVLRTKELLSERPHGHILKTGSGLLPDESIMSFTAYMFGVFQSHIAQGNVNFNRFLTLNSNPLNIPRHTGQRIFIRQNGEYQQLGIPSVFEMTLNGCRWIYKRGNLLFEIISSAAQDRAEITLHLRVLSGQAPEWFITNQLTSEHNWQLDSDIKNGARILKFIPGGKSLLSKMYPDGFFAFQFENSETIKQVGGDELLFVDGKSRGMQFLNVELTAAKEFLMTICGGLVKQNAIKKIKHNYNLNILQNKTRSSINEISEILPWFIHNSQIHYLSPHGLEQYGGAAWGTRDICQGPVEMLLSMEQYSSVRDILCKVFSNQNINGNWSQWWMFDRYKEIRNHESHGDVILWPILATSQYIRSSEDYDFLNQKLPYYEESQPCKIIDHILRAIKHIKANRFIHNTSLVNYDGGDWNDAMQPANPELKNKLISSWTVILSFHAFTEFAQICRRAGYEKIAEELENLCDAIKNDFNRFLLRDGVTAGFGYVNQNGQIELMLHPSDESTGVNYSLLPMTRGIISGIFTEQQAKLHLGLVAQHLKGPDGARLMDRSPKYHGGLQRYFKRAESCPFFGREIGLMYTHAHLRYAEALACMGQSELFVKTLRQAVPIDIQKVIPQANVRQSNCYYSSSDAGFMNRYEANRRYDDLLAGIIPLKGGWRIYSSGPGLFVRYVISHLLGIRKDFDKYTFDPVMPKELEGLNVQMQLAGRSVQMIYEVSGNERGIRGIEINRTGVELSRQNNPYRLGGASIDTKKLKALLNKEDNTIKISL
ncbi:MAG: hypothetical protein A2Y10_05480 [Planctomycetes bacterium GWF2_41_51]|nr:MAG: hypothetical protein A2Y10_05480 [Planctomycetes bacterium GWF2_41_51]HBG26790.1 hypothetical protein [Phycisphaerales bacterium]